MNCTRCWFLFIGTFENEFSAGTSILLFFLRSLFWFGFWRSIYEQTCLDFLKIYIFDFSVENISWNWCNVGIFVLKRCWRFWLGFSAGAVPKKTKKARNAKNAAGKVPREEDLGRQPGVFRVGALRAKQDLITKWFQSQILAEVFVSMFISHWCHHAARAWRCASELGHRPYPNDPGCYPTTRVALCSQCCNRRLVSTIAAG